MRSKKKVRKNPEIIKNVFIEEFPQLKLKHQVFMVYGDDYKNLTIGRRQLYRLLARNFTDIGSLGYSIEIFTPEMTEEIRTRAKDYLEYVLMIENKEFNLFDVDELHVFIEELLKIILETETYISRNDGVKVKIAKPVTQWLDEILISFHNKSNPKRQFSISSRTGGNKIITTALADELLLIAAGTKNKEENDDAYGTGKTISFPDVRKQTGLKQNRTIIKYLERLGLKYTIKGGVNYLTESNLEKLKRYSDPK